MATTKAQVWLAGLDGLPGPLQYISSYWLDTPAAVDFFWEVGGGRLLITLGLLPEGRGGICGAADGGVWLVRWCMATPCLKGANWVERISNTPVFFIYCGCERVDGGDAAEPEESGGRESQAATPEYASDKARGTYTTGMEYWAL